MTTEQDRVPRALEIAIEMETDGKECYLETSKESRNEAGKKLLQSLAE
jgi:rubrerythrin